jgi:hypothetical protein
MNKNGSVGCILHDSINIESVYLYSYLDRVPVYLLRSLYPWDCLNICKYMYVYIYMYKSQCTHSSLYIKNYRTYKFEISNSGSFKGRFPRCIVHRATSQICWFSTLHAPWKRSCSSRRIITCGYSTIVVSAPKETRCAFKQRSHRHAIRSVCTV